MEAPSLAALVRMAMELQADRFVASASR